jgi:hypothetical protein
MSFKPQKWNLPLYLVAALLGIGFYQWRLTCNNEEQAAKIQESIADLKSSHEMLVHLDRELKRRTILGSKSAPSGNVDSLGDLLSAAENLDYEVVSESLLAVIQDHREEEAMAALKNHLQSLVHQKEQLAEAKAEYVSGYELVDKLNKAERGDSDEEACEALEQKIGPLVYASLMLGTVLDKEDLPNIHFQDRRFGTIALPFMTDQLAKPFILADLQGGDPRLQIWASKTLARHPLPSPAIVAELRHLANDRNPTVSAAANSALTRRQQE